MFRRGELASPFIALGSKFCISPQYFWYSSFHMVKFRGNKTKEVQHIELHFTHIARKKSAVCVEQDSPTERASLALAPT